MNNDLFIYCYYLVFYARNGFRMLTLSNEDRLQYLYDHCNYCLVFSEHENFSKLPTLPTSSHISPQLDDYHLMLTIYVCRSNNRLLEFILNIPGIILYDNFIKLYNLFTIIL